MRKCIYGLFLSLLFSFSISAQSYKTGIGLRGGESYGISIKHFLNRTDALELIIHTKVEYQGAGFTLLYEKHHEAFGMTNLSWVYGGGGHIGFYDGKAKSWDKQNKSFILNVGVDAIFGIEYEVGDIPFTLGVDIKPFMDLISIRDGWFDGGFSIRYVF